MLPGAVWGAAQPTPQHDVTARLRRCGVAMRLVRRGPEGASRIAMRGPDPLTGAQCRRVDLGVFVSAWRMGVRLAEIPGQALNDPFWHGSRHLLSDPSATASLLDRSRSERAQRTSKEQADHVTRVRSGRGPRAVVHAASAQLASPATLSVCPCSVSSLSPTQMPTSRITAP